MKTIYIKLGIVTLVTSALAVGLFFTMQPRRHAPIRPALNDLERNAIVETYTPEQPFLSETGVTTATSAIPESAPVQLLPIPEPPVAGVPDAHFRIRNPEVKPGERWVRVPVLMYHYVRRPTAVLSRTGVLLSVTPEHFHAQMKEIADLGYSTITPDDLHAAVMGTAALPPKPVLITFDDGYRDQYTEAFPVMKEYGIKATFFIISDYASSSTQTAMTAYMTKEMIRDMDASGLATIGAHTRHHAALNLVKPETARDEIFGSKTMLEKMLDHPITSFAYPYGGFKDRIVSLVREAGFQTAYTTLLGSIHTPSSVLELRRVRVMDYEKLEPLLRRFGN